MSQRASLLNSLEKYFCLEMPPGQYGHSLPPHRWHRHRHRHTQICYLPPLISSLSPSLSVSLSITQQARQMASPWPAVPGKACELKVIPSRFEELPAPSLCSRGGAPAHLPPRIRDIWLGFCGMMSTLPPTTTTGTAPKGENLHLFSFSATKWTNERVCIIVYVYVEKWEVQWWLTVMALVWSYRIG